MPSAAQFCGERTGLALAGIKHCLARSDGITDDTTTNDLCHTSIKPATVPPGWVDEPELIQFDDGGKDISAERRYKHVYRRSTSMLNQTEWPSGTRSMCDVLLTDEDTKCFVGKPTHFLSHAWMYKILTVVGALEEFEASQPEGSPPIFWWFDCFSLNQHATQHVKNDRAWWSTTFKEAIGTIGHTVMLLLPWDAPTPLTRAWCLWELLCTVETGSQFSILLGPAEKKAFRTALLNDDGKSVIAALSTIDVEKSNAGDPHDRKMILGAVKASSGGAEALNERAVKQLRENFVGKEARDWIAELRSPDGALRTGDALRAGCAVARLLGNHLGHWQESRRLWEDVVVGNTLLRGVDAELTLQAVGQLAVAMYRTGEKCPGYNLLRSVELRMVAKLGPGLHPLVLEVQANRAALAMDSKASLSTWDMVVAGRSALLGSEAQPTLIARFNRAMTLKKLGQIIKAKAEYVAVLAVQTRLLGKRHPEVLVVQHALAVLLYEKLEESEEGLRLMREVVQVRGTVLGDAHPDARRSAMVLARWEAKKEAEKKRAAQETARVVDQTTRAAEQETARAVCIEGLLLQPEYNGVYRRVPAPWAYEGGVRFESEQGTQLYQCISSRRWSLNKTFTPYEVRPAAFVDLPGGVFPAEEHVWYVKHCRHRQQLYRQHLTVTLLQTEAEVGEQVAKQAAEQAAKQAAKQAATEAAKRAVVQQLGGTKAVCIEGLLSAPEYNGVYVATGKDDDGWPSFKSPEGKHLVRDDTHWCLGMRDSHGEINLAVKIWIRGEHLEDEVYIKDEVSIEDEDEVSIWDEDFEDWHPFEDRIEWLLQQLPQIHCTTAISLLHTDAEVSERTGRLQRCEQALARKMEDPGSDHEDLLTSQIEFALCLGQMGRVAEAKALLKVALKKVSKAEAPDEDLDDEDLDDEDEDLDNGTVSTRARHWLRSAMCFSPSGVAWSTRNADRFKVPGSNGICSRLDTYPGMVAAWMQPTKADEVAHAEVLRRVRERRGRVLCRTRRQTDTLAVKQKAANPNKRRNGQSYGVRTGRHWPATVLRTNREPPKPVVGDRLEYSFKVNGKSQWFGGTVKRMRVDADEWAEVRFDDDDKLWCVKVPPNAEGKVWRHVGEQAPREPRGTLQGCF
eukprot:COSAG02_NODE_620_length_19443_cov_91.259564_2_plen_1130_part_00